MLKRVLFLNGRSDLKVLLLIFGQFLSPTQEGAMMEVHRQSGGFTPPAP